jgi:hypothetical protein
MYDEKRKVLSLARDFLGCGEDSMLRHAALELRRYIEAVVYQKLAAYQGRLPQPRAKGQVGAARQIAPASAVHIAKRI